MEFIRFLASCAIAFSSSLLSIISCSTFSSAASDCSLTDSVGSDAGVEVGSKGECDAGIDIGGGCSGTGDAVGSEGGADVDVGSGGTGDTAGSGSCFASFGAGGLQVLEGVVEREVERLGVVAIIVDGLLMEGSD